MSNFSFFGAGLKFLEPIGANYQLSVYMEREVHILPNDSEYERDGEARLAISGSLQ